MRHDSDGRRLPIKLDSTSNGEVAPMPLERVHLRANALAHQAADANAKRLGLSRRRLLVSAAGAAGTLLAFNEAYAAAGRTGGFYEIEQTAALDVEQAAQRLGSREFIFDVQGHFVGRNWQGRHGLGGVDQFVKDVFLDSDTDMMVLSFIPSRRENEYLPIAEAAAVQEIVSRLPRGQRLLIHGRVNPNQPGDMEDIDALASRWKVSALKCYTQWGPDGRGFYLTDDIGVRMIEKARSVGIRNICVHKGLPFGRQSYEHSTCADIGRVAKMFPDVNFLVYHAGYVQTAKEGPYDPTRSDGVDRLIRSVEEAGLGKGSNVYGELGSTWRMLMRDPDQAAHVVGKLVKHLGEGNVLWGVGLHLVRLPAGPDPGVPHLPDLERIPGEVRLRSDDPAAAGAHLRAQRRAGVRPRCRGSHPSRGRRRDRPGPRRVRARSALPHVRAENPGAVPAVARRARQPAGVEVETWTTWSRFRPGDGLLSRTHIGSSLLRDCASDYPSPTCTRTQHGAGWRPGDAWPTSP